MSVFDHFVKLALKGLRPTFLAAKQSQVVKTKQKKKENEDSHYMSELGFFTTKKFSENGS